MTVSWKKERKKQLSTIGPMDSSVRGQGNEPRHSEQMHDHSGLSPNDYWLLQLQRTHGNQAVQRVIREQFQPKLKVGKSDDKFEREADRVAEQTMRIPEPGLQRQINPEKEEEELPQTQPLVQRRAAGEEGDNEVPPIVNEVLRLPGQPLDPQSRTAMESRFGHDFSQVRVHTDAKATDSARAVSAQAYTAGRDLVFGVGKFMPGMPEGDRLLAHELAHVVQQGFAPANEPLTIGSEKDRHVWETDPMEAKETCDFRDRSFKDVGTALSNSYKTASGIERRLQKVPDDSSGPEESGGLFGFFAELTQDTTDLASQLITMLNPAAINTSDPNINQISTSEGLFHRFPVGATHTNSNNRPRFEYPESIMQVYTGTGSNGSAKVHPEVIEPLNRMMSALRAEGNRLNDESMKQAIITSAYRPSTEREGRLYLSALKKTIRLNPKTFKSATFPPGLETMAKSNLSDDQKFKKFKRSIAKQPRWNTRLANQLIRMTGRVKAPRGRSPHHSGLVVDINFPYAKDESTVEWHGTDRRKNADALRSAAGVWLNNYSIDFDFDSYNTGLEIWHHEWRNWPGTSADPKSSGP